MRGGRREEVRGKSRAWKAAGLALALLVFPGRTAWAGGEWVTVPLIALDYYGWAYTEIFEDKADVFGWSTAGVDALGWTLLAAGGDADAGLKLVNLAGLAKTAYPLATLLGASDRTVRQRAWIALGTHAATLLTLGFLGRPALSVDTTMGPRRDGTGMVLSCRF